MSAAVAVIQFLLDLGDGTELDFLRLWNEGEFDKCRKEWPEAPEACYIGADPLHPLTAVEPAGCGAAYDALFTGRGAGYPMFEKGWMAHDEQTKANFIFMSGDKDALRVTPNDRRFAVVWPLDQEEAARKQFEALASDSYGFKRSRKGTYVNGSTARDWKWFRLGMRAAP